MIALAEEVQANDIQLDIDLKNMNLNQWFIIFWKIEIKLINYTTAQPAYGAFTVAFLNTPPFYTGAGLL